MAKQINVDVLRVTLAALLHDIGKPFQRAVKSEKNRLDAQSRGLESQVRRGDKPYSHCLWTNQFINEIPDQSPIWACGINRSDLTNSAVFHHNPRGDHADDMIIKMADGASAGMDRDQKEKRENDLSLKYYQRPLDWLFTTTNLPRDEFPAPQRMSAPLNPIDESKDLDSIHTTVFPRHLENIHLKYADLCDQFKRRFHRIQTRNPAILLDTIVSLLQKYFWCVPSSTMENQADIPLCDHMTTTAAIAACMAHAHYEYDIPVKDVRFRLIAGDFSGIQDFIFSLSGESNRQIAKLLRGRSFTVSTLTQLTARLLTDEIGLPSLCCITGAAGRFLVLVPDTPNCEENFRSIRKKVEQWTLDRFFGDLKVVLSCGAPFNIGGFQMGTMETVLSDVEQKLQRAKRRPFASLGDSMRWVDDQRYGSFQTNRVCPVCGREPAAGGHSGGERKNGLNCEYFIRTGRDLMHAQYLCIRKQQCGGKLFDTYDMELCRSAGDELDSWDAVYRINLHKTEEDGNDMPVLPELHYASYKPKVETVSEEPGDDETVQEGADPTFEEIAKAGEGIDALAVLKADVDNMGYVLSAGFRGKNSISRQVAFSRMLNWFFAGYIPLLLRGRYPDVYTVFAGGDDLCLIGQWSKTITLAKEIRERFNEYVGKNPAITLSAGIELFKPAHPVVRAVDRAEENLEKAKEAEKKNSIHLLGSTMSWQKEMHEQLEFAQHWQTYVGEMKKKEGDGFTGMAMLYRFLTYHDQWAGNQTDPIRGLQHRFRFIYDINRNIDEDWRCKEPFIFLQKTKTDDGIPLEKTTKFMNLRVGISMAVYKNRKS